MNIFLKEFNKIIKENNLLAVSDCLLSIYLNHSSDDDRTEVFNTNKNTLYLCGKLEVQNLQTNEILKGKEIKAYFEKLNFKNKDLMFILSNQNIIEKHGFKIKYSPFFEIMSNTNDEDFSTPFDLIPVNNLDIFIDEVDNVCL